jgi:ElaB/YqjD/DUF883 family membrane-anchored ribosome-binding protein
MKMFNRKEENISPPKAEKASNGSFPDAIRENVVGLAHNLKDAGNDTAHMALEFVQESAQGLKTSGTDTLARIEKRIHAKPGQSVAIAFAAGIVASFLFGRRS